MRRLKYLLFGGATGVMPSISGLFLLFFLLFPLQWVEARSVSPLPANLADMQNFRGENGTVYYFYVTGSTSNGIWGTGIYTDDSSLTTAAVHAGILSDGQTGVVKVTILPGQNSYPGSTANGVTSGSYGEYAASYSVAVDDGGDNPVLPGPSNLTDYRSILGAVYLFNVTGDAAGGPIWGTNVYTDDAHLATAVVHTGLLADGQNGVVKIVIGPPQYLEDPWGNNYPGCTYNGVTSIGYYNQWAGTYSLMHPTIEKALIPYPGTIDNPLPNPGNLINYRGLNEGAFYFDITGTAIGSIWGTGIYTDDSGLSTAAVHAGVLASGESDTIKAIVLPGQLSYSGTSANGVDSISYGAWVGSFSVGVADGDEGSLPVITSKTSARAIIGKSFSYQIIATNAPTAYSATGLPMGLSINNDTGLISGIPELTGVFVINLLVKNDIGVRSGTLVLKTGMTPSTALFPTLFLLLD